VKASFFIAVGLVWALNAFVLSEFMCGMIFVVDLQEDHKNNKS